MLSANARFTQVINDKVLDRLKNMEVIELNIERNSPDNADLISWLRECRRLKSIKLHFLSQDNLYDEFTADLQDLFTLRSDKLPILVWVGPCKVLDSTNS